MPRLLEGFSMQEGVTHHERYLLHPKQPEQHSVDRHPFSPSVRVPVVEADRKHPWAHSGVDALEARCDNRLEDWLALDVEHTVVEYSLEQWCSEWEVQVAPMDQGTVLCSCNNRRARVYDVSEKVDREHFLERSKRSVGKCAQLLKIVRVVELREEAEISIEGDELFRKRREKSGM